MLLGPIGAGTNRPRFTPLRPLLNRIRSNGHPSQLLASLDTRVSILDDSQILFEFHVLEQFIDRFFAVHFWVEYMHTANYICTCGTPALHFHPSLGGSGEISKMLTVYKLTLTVFSDCVSGVTMITCVCCRLSIVSYSERCPCPREVGGKERNECCCWIAAAGLCRTKLRVFSEQLSRLGVA